MNMRQRAFYALVLTAVMGVLVFPVAISADGETPGAVAVEAATAAPVGQRATVANAWLGLRVRSGPSLAEAVRYSARNGDEVVIVSDPVWNQGVRWVEVEVDTPKGLRLSGWVASAYLDNYPGYDEPHDGYIGAEGYKVTATSGLRLRGGPGLLYRTERIVPYGTILERTPAASVMSDGLEWVQLDLCGAALWAARNYIQKVP